MSFQGKGIDAKDTAIWTGLGWGLGKPFPESPVDNQVITYTETDNLFVVRQPSYVNGKLWMPSSPNILGYGYVPTGGPSLVSSTNEGATFTTYSVDPAPGTIDGYAPVKLLKDSLTGTLLLVTERTYSQWFEHSGSNSSPDIRLYTVTDDDPFTLGSYNSLYYSPNSTQASAVYAAIAPGDGFIYATVETNNNSGSVNLYKIDATTRIVVDALSLSSNHVYRIEYDGSTAKYGDGIPRIYGVDHSSGIYRIKLDPGGMVLESNTGAIPTGGPPFVPFMAGPIVDGPNNALWTVARSAGNGTFYLVKTTLQPFVTTTSYSLQLPQPEANSSCFILDVVRDPTTGNITTWWYDQSDIWPSDPSKSYITVHQDTGSAFNLLYLYAVPESMGASSIRETSSYPGNDPYMCVLPSGKVVIPYIGGLASAATTLNMYSANVPTKRNTALVLNSATPATPVVIGGVAAKYSWETPLDPLGGDLSLDNSNLVRVSSLQQTPVGTSMDQYSGMVLGLDTSGHLTTQHPRRLQNATSDVGFGQFNEGGTLRNSNAKTITLYPKTTDTGIDFRDYPVDFHEAFSSKTAQDSNNRFTVTSGFPLYGLDSNPAYTNSSYTFRGARESVTFLWDSQTQRWKCAGRYTPWEAAYITTGSTQLSGARNLALYTGATTATVLLPLSPNDGDEVLIKDSGNAGGVVTYNSFDRAIDNVAANTNLTLSGGTNPWVHLQFNRNYNKWYTISKSYNVPTVYDEGSISRQLQTVGRVGAASTTVVSQSSIPTSYSLTSATSNDKYLYLTSDSNNGDIFSTQGPSVSKTDGVVASASLFARYSFPATAKPAHVIYDGRYIWTANNSGNSISQFNEDLTLVGTYATGTGGFTPSKLFHIPGVGIVVIGGLGVTRRDLSGTFNYLAVSAATVSDGVWDGTYLYIPDPSAGSIKAYNIPATGALSLSFTIAINNTGCVGLTFDGQNLWTTSISTSTTPKRLIKINLASRVVTSYAPDTQTLQFDKYPRFNGSVIIAPVISSGSNNLCFFYDPDTGQRIGSNVGVGGLLTYSTKSSWYNYLGGSSNAALIIQGGTPNSLYSIVVSGDQVGAFSMGLFGPNGQVRSGHGLVTDTLNYIEAADTEVDTSTLQNYNSFHLKGALGATTRKLKFGLNSGVRLIDNEVTATGAPNGVSIATTDAVNHDTSFLLPGKQLVWADSSSTGGIAQICVLGNKGIYPYTISANQTLPNTSSAHAVYPVNSSGGPVTLTEPVVRRHGMAITLVDVGGSAGSNNITFSGTGVVGPATVNNANGSRTWQWNPTSNQWIPLHYGPAAASAPVSSIITPTILGAGVNNYNPTGLAAANGIRASSSLDVNITGFAALLSTDTIFKKLFNVGSFNLSLLHLSGGSSAANQFQIPGGATLIMQPDDCVDLFYDVTTAKWRVA